MRYAPVEHESVNGRDCSFTRSCPRRMAGQMIPEPWEAFQQRGADDPLMSHDLEDIITPVADRPTIVTEVAATAREARPFIARSTRDFLAGPWAEEIVAGCLPDARGLPGYTDLVLSRLRELARPRRGSGRR